jgi:hypothetical protein
MRKLVVVLEQCLACLCHPNDIIWLFSLMSQNHLVPALFCDYGGVYVQFNLGVVRTRNRLALVFIV